MTSAEWAILVPAVAGCLGAFAAWLRASAAHRAAADAKAQIAEKS